jgi:hypothetical protein
MIIDIGVCVGIATASDVEQGSVGCEGEGAFIWRGGIRCSVYGSNSSTS